MLEAKSKIDTSDLNIKTDDIKDLNQLTNIPSLNLKKNKSIRLEQELDQDKAKIKFVFQPCKINGGLDTTEQSYTYSYYNKKKQEIKDSGAVNTDTELEISRVDICFDFEEELKELMPILNILGDVYAVRYKAKNKNNKKYSSSCCALYGDTLGRLVKTDRYELDIYDKNYESNGIYPYKTRIEFRFKQTTKTFKNSNNELHILKDLLGFFDKDYLSTAIDEAIEVRAEKLYQDYLINNKIHKLDFKSFAMTQLDNIGCKEVLEAVYSKLGMKNFKEWLYKFKRSTGIEIYSKRDLMKLLRNCKRSLKEYIKK